MKYSFNINSEYFLTSEGKEKLNKFIYIDNVIKNNQKDILLFKEKNNDLKKELCNMHTIDKYLMGLSSSFILLSAIITAVFTTLGYGMGSIILESILVSLTVSPLSYLLTDYIISKYNLSINRKIEANNTKMYYDRKRIESNEYFLKLDAKSIKEDLEKNDLNWEMPITIIEEENIENKEEKNKVLVK